MKTALEICGALLVIMLLFAVAVPVTVWLFIWVIHFLPLPEMFVW